MLRSPFVYLLLINVIDVSARVGGGHGGHGGHGSHTGHGGHGGHGWHGTSGHVSAHHAHYSYHPPSHISYICRDCSAPAHYPTYHGLPPTYVYRYRESGSRYGDILTGLALYNLGRTQSENWHYMRYYSPRSDEKCSLQVIDRSHFEDTIIPCFMMSSFIDRAAEMPEFYEDPNLVDISSSRIDVKPYLQNNGAPLKVNRDQKCVLWHNVTDFKDTNHIPCALLKEYAETMKPSGVPVYIWLPTLVFTVLGISLCCHFCKFKKKNSYSKEDVPLSQNTVGSRTNYD